MSNPQIFLLIQGVSKTGPKIIQHYFLIYRWKINETYEAFCLSNCKQHAKTSKLSIILLGFIGLAKNDHHLSPCIFSSAQRNSTNTLLQTNLGLTLISLLVLTFESEMFLGCWQTLDASHNPRERMLGAKIRTMGRPLKFLVLLSHILLIGHWLAFVLSVYDVDICSNPLQLLFCQLTCSNSKIGCDAETIVLAPLNRFLCHLYNLLCASPGSSE